MENKYVVTLRDPHTDQVVPLAVFTSRSDAMETERYLRQSGFKHVEIQQREKTNV